MLKMRSLPHKTTMKHFFVKMRGRLDYVSLHLGSLKRYCKQFMNLIISRQRHPVSTKPSKLKYSKIR